MHTEKLTGNTCECAVCDERFNSVGAFDAHRYTNRERGTRHCMTPEQMIMAFMQPDDKHRWSPPRKPAAA